MLLLASLLSAALAQGTQSGASWPALGGSTQRSGSGLASGPTDSSVERKWTYSIPSDTSASGPGPLVDSAGNIILVTSGGSLRSLSTTSPTSPSPLFSGTQRDASVLGACTAIPLASAPTANVFTFTSTPSVSFYASGQAVYVSSLGGCSAASLSLTTIYYYIPLSATTFSLSTSQSTLTPITITCTGTVPTLITSMPGAQLSIPAYPGVILAIGTAVVASLPCSPSPCTNTVLTSTVLAPSSSAWTLATLTPVLSSISGSAFATTANAIAAFTVGGSTPTAFIFSSLGSCVTSPALSLLATYYVISTGAPTATSFTFATAVTGGTTVSITSCTTYPTIVVHQTSYTVTPTSGASKFSVTGVASGTLTVANSNSDFVQWQPFIFTSVGTGCSNPPSLTQVYYVASATTTAITYTATQFGGALTSYTTCTTFPVIQPYTQSSGCISTASIAAVAGTTPTISYTSTAPPVLNWAATISGSSYSLGGVAQSLSQPSFTFQPITATPVFDNNGNLWLPVGQFLLKVLLATGVPQGAYQTSCPVLTTAGSFTASISGSTLTITSIVSTFSGYIAAGTGAQPMTITSVTSPYLPIGALLTASTSSSTTITVVGLSSGQYSVIASPAFTSGLGTSSSPVSFTATLPIGLVLSATGAATGAATGTSIVAVSDTGVSNVYIVSPSQTVASTSTFTSITGLPTSPVIDASGNVVYTCGSSIVSLPLSSNAPTTRLTASFTAPLSVMSYSSRSANFYAGDSVGNVWAWNLGSTSVASWFTSTTQVWAWPPSPWPTGVQAMTNGLNAALAPPVVGSTNAGVEQVYVIMCTTAQLCRINALAAATGSDNWLYGTVQSGIQSGFLLDLCYFSTASIVANDKVALLCVSSPASSVSTLKVITNTAVGGLSHSSFSGFKFSTPPVVDASGSTLYFGGRDGCVTGFSLASYTSTWQQPSGCASSGTLSSFGTVQPALTSSVSAATVAATGSSGTPGYLVAMDSSLTVHAYGRYGSATPTASATASGTNSLSISATARPSASAGASGSGTYCASATQTVSPSASSCGSASGSLSPTLSTTTSSTLTASPTLTASACASGSTTGSSTACVSATQSSTQSVTASMCQSSSLSASSTASPSDSMSNSPAPTYSFSLPSTPSALPTSTATLTGSPTPTGTPSQTPTQTPSFTPWQAAIAAAASAAAASAAAAAAAGKGSSPSNSSLTDASVAMIVIGTIFLVAALALYYIYLRHPELLHAVFGGPSDKSKSSGGSGSGGSSGSSGSSSRNSRSQNESAEGSEGAEGGWEGQSGSGGGGSAPSNASYRGDVEQGVNSSSSSSSRASRLNSRTPAGVDESQFNFSSSGVGNLSPYSTHTYVESGSSSVNESSMLGMTAASAAVGAAAAAAASATQATPGTASRSALKSSQRSSSAAAASYSLEEAQQPPPTEEAPSRRSASSGSRARSRSKGAVNDEEEEVVVEAPPTGRRITTAMRRGSLSVKRNSKLAQTPAASYEDFTQSQ